MQITNKEIKAFAVESVRQVTRLHTEVFNTLRASLLARELSLMDVLRAYAEGGMGLTDAERDILRAASDEGVRRHG